MWWFWRAAIPLKAPCPTSTWGLLLALAGLDYSKVQEPGGVRPRESRDIIRQVAETCREVRELWKTRQDVDLKSVFGSGPFFERRRQIYYDTDNIYESQQEYIRLCQSCPGWRVVYTSSTWNRTPALRCCCPGSLCKLPWGGPGAV